jgi:hypothetical protein
MDLEAITTAAGVRFRSGASLSWNGRTLFLSPRIFRDLLLVWVLPTTAALFAVAVIAVERMQADPVAVAPERVNTSFAWLAIALGFVLLHVAGNYISSLNVMTASEHVQRWAALVLVIGVGCLVMFGVPAGWSVPLPAELNRGLAIMFMLVYMSPILIFPVVLLLFAVAALAFAVLLALATAPGLFRRETQAVVGRTFIAHIVVSPIALLVGVLGSFVAQTMFPSVGRIDSIADLVTASSANGPYRPASIALLSCAIACTLICGGTFLAREESPPRAALPTVGLVVAIQLALSSRSSGVLARWCISAKPCLR